MDRLAMNELEAVRISDRIQGEPETAAADAYYFAKPLTHSVYYIQYNICREAEDLPMEDFAALAAKDLNAGAGRGAEALGVPGPDPAAGPTPATSRQGPIPAVLAQGWEQDAVTWAWDIGLLPAGADFSKDIIRTQGETLAESFGKLID